MSQPHESAMKPVGLVIFLVVLLLAVAGLAYGYFVVKPKKEAARAETCRANMACLGRSLLMYAADNGGRLPPAAGEEWVLAAEGQVHLVEAFCPKAKEGREGYWVARLSRATLREAGEEFDQAELLAYMKARGQRLSSYELAPEAAGKRIEEMGREVILREAGARHDGVAHVVLGSGEVRERPAGE